MRAPLLTLLLLLPFASPAAEHHVQPNGLGDFPDIQTALDAAASGDTVVLHDGVFQGPGNRDLRPGDKTITVRSLSESAVDCILGFDGYPGFWQEDTRALILEHLTLRGGARADGGAVHVWHGTVNATGCHFLNNSGSEAGAIWAVNGSANRFTDCLFSGNAGGDGALLFNVDLAIFEGCKFIDNGAGSSDYVIDTLGGHLRLEDCVFRDNRSQWGTVKCHAATCWIDACLFADNITSGTGAVYLWSEGGTIQHSTFVGNAGDDSAHLFAADVEAPYDHLLIDNCVFAHGDAREEVVVGEADDNVTIRNCNIYTAGHGWQVFIADQLDQDGNIDLPPVFCDLANADFSVADVSPCLPANNPGGQLIGRYGEGCQLTEWRVAADGAGLLMDIQSALDLAPDGTEILLGDGVFTGHRNRDLDPRGKAVTVRSTGGYAACVLDAASDLEDRFRSFICHSDEDTSTVIEGVTLTGCRAGAVSCEGASPLFRNCRFTGNIGEGYAGAVAASAGSAPVLEHCLLDHNEGNLGAAVSSRDGSHVTLRNCTVVHNDGAISSLAAWDADLTLERTIISGDLGGAALVTIGAANLSVSDCDIHGNAGGDYTGMLVDLLGTDGNFSADPCFCDAASSVYDLCADSWCLPAHNPTGRPVQVGALGEGCEACDCADLTGAPPVVGDLLFTAAPNPFNPATELSFVLGKAAWVTVTVVDLRGRLVAELVDGSLAVGRHVALWNGRDRAGRQVAGGVYLGRLKVGETERTVKLAICK